MFLDGMFISPTDEVDEALGAKVPQSDNDNEGTSCYVVILLLIAAIFISIFL